MVQMQGSPQPLVGQFDHIIVGEYQLFKYNPPNNFHYMNITTTPRANVYIWRARSGASWSLALVSSEKEKEEDRGTLTFDVGDSPYYDYTTANLYYDTDEVQIEGPFKEMFTKLGGSSASAVATTSVPSTDTSAIANSDTSTTTSTPSAPTVIILISAIAGILLVVMVIAIIVCISCKQFKKERKAREEVVKEEDNPVYQQYQFVGETYERQYSTHEVVDNNDYYG